jgi:hypothetical protein
VNKVDNGKLEGQVHHQRNKNRKQDDSGDRFLHSKPFDPFVLHNKEVAQQGNRNGKEEIVEANKNIKQMHHYEAAKGPYIKNIIQSNLCI